MHLKVHFQHVNLSKPDKNLEFATSCIEALGSLINSTRETVPDLPPPRPYISPPHSDVVLFYGHTPLVTKIRSTLRCLLYQDQKKATICKQEHWSELLFHQVDWGAQEYSFLRTWSCKRIAYTKLSHGLLNTNMQNKKFYGNSDLCPCCSLHPETLQHVFTFPSPEVATFCHTKQDILWNNLHLINTPDAVGDSIKCGLMSLESRQPCSPARALLPAFVHQTSLRWEAFLRGRISFQWWSAFNLVADFDDWSCLKLACQLITFLLQYSQQLWIFWCGVLHGHTKEEHCQKHCAELLTQIKGACEEYAKDPFHIPSDWRRIFIRPFLSLANLDRDTLACWLRSYSEACQQHMLVTMQSQRQSKQFFSSFRHPKSCPPAPNISASQGKSDGEDDDSIRSVTVGSSSSGSTGPPESLTTEDDGSLRSTEDDDSIATFDSAILGYVPFAWFLWCPFTQPMGGVL